MFYADVSLLNFVFKCFKCECSVLNNMEDLQKKGDPRAIIAAIVALLNTLSVVLGIDMGNVIAQIERMCEEREHGGSSTFASESEQSDVAGTTVPGQKRHRRQHRGKRGKHPRAVILEPVAAEPTANSSPVGMDTSGRCYRHRPRLRRKW